MTEPTGPLFDGALDGPTNPVLPPWFRGGTTTQRAHVVRGRHPLGFPLMPNPMGAKCGSCEHTGRWGDVANPGAYLKCGKRLTRGPATDIRRKWPACINYVRRGATKP